MGIKKAYYYLYYKMYNFGVAISDDAINEWKPLVSILVLEVLLIGETLVWYTIITRKVVALEHPGLVALPVVTVIGLGNYFFFLGGNKWRKYESEFRKHSRKKKILGGIIVTAFVLSVLLSVVFSFYQLSQINWRERL